MKSNDIRVKGVTRRWLVSIVGVVVLIVVVVQVICSVLIYNFFYNSVSGSLNMYAENAESFLKNYSAASSSEFELLAKDFINDYNDKNIVEMQIFDRWGNMIVSSGGFVPQNIKYEDLTAAKTNKSGKASWNGRNSNGEHIMAVSVVAPEVSSVRIGAARVTTSLEEVDRYIMYAIAVIFGIGLFVIAVTVISGVLFLRSILQPVRAITATAFRIANGNFNDRLPVREADEIGKLCDTINYMASELASTEKLKNDFISSVSHELRTPLTVIKGWGETVRSSIGVDDELTVRGVDVIVKESERLSGLVEDLLDFSRMQSGRLELKKQKIDILAELGEAVYMYQDVARQHGVSLVYIEPEILPAVMGDAARLKQVFINIIDNAIKYSQSGGQVLVEASQHDIYVQVVVKDTGCGIAAEDIGRVKEKFYKANKTVRGSGIGLAIADEIIKQHDGILEIDSREGAGTTVSIVLPFIQPVKSDNTAL